RIGPEPRECSRPPVHASAGTRRGAGHDVTADVAQRRDPRHAGAAPVVTRRPRYASTLAIPNETRKLGTVAPMPHSGGWSRSTASAHPAAPAETTPGRRGSPPTHAAIEPGRRGGASKTSAAV